MKASSVHIVIVVAFLPVFLLLSHRLYLDSGVNYLFAFIVRRLVELGAVCTCVCERESKSRSVEGVLSILCFRSHDKRSGACVLMHGLSHILMRIPQPAFYSSTWSHLLQSHVYSTHT